jgi:putative peptidoglycan lipid II flippase
MTEMSSVSDAVVAGAVPAADTDAGRTSLPGRMLRTAGLVTVITSLGSLLGLIRDVLLARFFGASVQTDAFLVAWTVPETITPLLMEGALAFLLIPLLSRELEVRGTMDRVVGRTFLPVVIGLAVLTAAVAALAPVIVAVLTPGLQDPELAVRCFRAAALTVLFLGTSGYMMSVLRASEQFLVPSWVYVAYNVGILACIVPFHGRYGVLIAAVGLSVGGALMVVVQVPAFLRRVSLRSLRLHLNRRLLMAATTFLPLGLYTIGRQAQVYVERYFGSDLDPGTISHLNYATKIAQIPVVMATTVALISLPALSRDAAADRRQDYRRGVEHNLRLGMLLIFPAMTMLIAFAPEIVHVLFQRGAFLSADTASTAGIMRVYTLGLLGQTLTVVTTLCFFSVGRTSWYPGVAAVVGLVVTIAVSGASFHSLGARGLALGNATGISVAAAMLMVGVHRRVIPIDLGQVLGTGARCATAAVGAGVVGAACGRALVGLPTPLVLVLAVPATAAVYVSLCLALRVAEMEETLGGVRRRLVRWGSERVATPNGPGAGAARESLAEPVDRSSPRRVLALLVLAAVVGAALGFASTAVMTRRYTATATLLVSPSGNPPASGSLGYAQAAARLATKQSVLDVDGPDWTGGVRPDALRVAAAPDSPLFELTADARDATAAAALCNRAAESLAGTLTARDAQSGFRVTVAGAAVPPDDPVSPNRRVSALVGLVLGGLTGVVVLVLRAARQQERTARSAELGARARRASHREPEQDREQERA